MIEQLEPRQLLSAGDLDTTFHTTGQFIGGTSGGGAHQIAVQPNGNLVVATGTTDIFGRDYSPSGQLLATFDATTAVSNLFPNGAMSVAVQSDDKMLLAGGASADLTNDGTAMVARFQPTGQLDTTWNGTGLCQLTLPGVKQLSVAALAIQKDGKVIAAGGADDSFFVARFTTAGALDSTFDGDGIKTFSFPQGTAPSFVGAKMTYWEMARGVAVQDDGKIVVGGPLETQPDDAFEDWLGIGIARLNPDGALDSAFGTGGEVVLGGGVYPISSIPVNARRLGIQPDGRIVMSAVLNNSASLVRFNTNGSLDTSFDQDGILSLPETGTDAFDFLSNGQMMVVSASGTTTNLRRINQNGSIDTSFGAGGVVTTEWNTPQSGITGVEASALTVQPDGKVVVGVGRFPQSLYSLVSGIGLARYVTDVPGPLISGTVSNDANKNGVADAGEGAAGIQVYLDRNHNGAIDSGEPVATTNASGHYQFANVLIGSYDVREVVPTGWVAKTPANAVRTVSIVAGDPGPAAIDFLNAQPAGGSIAGVVYNDANNDGKPDNGEPGIASITIYNDANNNNKLDAGEKTTITDSNGAYALTGLSAGSYKIRQILQSGWSQTTPANNFGWTITLATNQDVTAKDFGARQLVAPGHCAIGGTIWDDLNGNGTTDANEIVSGRTVYIDSNHNDVLDPGEPTTVSSNGHYEFDNLAPATYYVREVLPAGWRVRFPSVGEWGISFGSDGVQILSADFVNERTPGGGSISGTVFNDVDGDRVHDANEAGVAGVTIYNDANNNSKLDSGELTTVTDPNGVYVLSSLGSGSYKIREILQSGWTQTTPTNNYGWTITLASNQNLTGKDFGTKQSGVTPPPPTGGSIAGVVFNDLDGDRVKDSNEVGVANITIYNDANNNSKLDAGELTTTTDSSGAYTLANLSAGSYKIREILQSGWSQTAPTNNYGWTISLATNQQLTGKNFGTKQNGVTPPPSTGSISGFTFNDNNKNGAFDAGDVKTSGKTVFLDTNNNGKLDSGEKSVVSDVNGNWSFSGLVAGTYHVRRVFPSGYTYSTTLIDVTLNAGDDDMGLLIGSEKIA